MNVRAIVARIVLKEKIHPLNPPPTVAVPEVENPVPVASPVQEGAQVAVLICKATRLRLWCSRCCWPLFYASQSIVLITLKFSLDRWITCQKRKITVSISPTAHPKSWWKTISNSGIQTSNQRASVHFECTR